MNSIARSWAQVDIKGREIRLRHGETKNDEGRTLPIYGDRPGTSQHAHSVHGFSRRAASVLRVSAKREHLPAHVPACLACCFTTYGVQPCATWNVPAYLAKPPWPSLATKQRPVYWRYAMSNDRDIRDAGRKLERYFKEIRTTAAKKITKSITVPVAKSPRHRKPLV